jgi:coenzyme F420-0:L-glutamate ligase/coenzyme F420-1:gamma-L-glutamate ligase
MRPVTIHPLGGIGEVKPGDDLVSLLAAALGEQGLDLQAGDILVVTSKIMSKAEGRFADLAEVEPGVEALRLAEVTRKEPRLVELALREASAVVRAAPHVLILRHRLGHVMANAGIDQSNLGPDGGGAQGAGKVLLLPLDPDASAAGLRKGLADRFGVAPAIVVSDSFGRPWRNGVVNVAVGASGLPALLDRRGQTDRDGRVLEVTQIAVGDIVATAAGMVCGEGGEGIPAALVRGYVLPQDDGTQHDRPAADLLRPVEQDLFR